MYSLETANFAGRLKTLRKAKGMTQEKAAEELNISMEHLGNMERGQGKPSLELLVRSLSTSMSVPTICFWDANLTGIPSVRAFLSCPRR